MAEHVNIGASNEVESFLQETRSRLHVSYTSAVMYRKLGDEYLGKGVAFHKLSRNAGLRPNPNLRSGEGREAQTEAITTHIDTAVEDYKAARAALLRATAAGMALQETLYAEGVLPEEAIQSGEASPSAALLFAKLEGVAEVDGDHLPSLYDQAWEQAHEREEN